MDWNNDGKGDLIAGDTKGDVWMYLNVGKPGTPELAAGKRVEADGKPIAAGRRTYTRVDGKTQVQVSGGSSKLAESYTKIHVADWDGDGLKDLLVGHSYSVILYKNGGTLSAPRLAAPVAIEVPGGKFPLRPSPCVADWDGDGKQDLLVGCEKSKVYFFRNVGTPKAPRLEAGKELPLRFPDADVGYRYFIHVVDWNNDGKKDLLLGNFASSKRSPGQHRAGGNIWLFLGK